MIEGWVLWAAIAQVETVEEPGMLALLTDADIIVQGVLFVLVAMSVICWGIIGNRWKVLSKAQSETAAFLDTFWKSRRLDQVYDGVDRFAHSPVAVVFKAGYKELTSFTAAAPQDANAIQIAAEDNVVRALRRTRTVERSRLEQSTAFLATTGSTAPFIGLFGTVWGILRAFQKIGATGQATIATVGPDIAHALIATAVGLAAAIPAVMAYNYFNSRVRALSTEMDNFSDDFLNIVKRHVRSR